MVGTWIFKRNVRRYAPAKRPSGQPAKPVAKRVPKPVPAPRPVTRAIATSTDRFTVGRYEVVSERGYVYKDRLAYPIAEAMALRLAASERRPFIIRPSA